MTARLATAVFAFAVLLFGAVPTATAAVVDSPGAPTSGSSTYDWVGSWMTAAERPGTHGPAGTGFADQTLRQVVDLSLGGELVRVRLTNVFGDRPLRVGSASLARRLGPSGATTAGRPVPLTFGGRRATTIPAGVEVLSDPVELAVPDRAHLLVSLYFPEPTGPATWHRRGWATTFLAEGDAGADPRADRFAAVGTSTYFLAGIDVLTRSAGAIVAFGDSITEGCCEELSIDADTSYPDRLAERLREPGQRLAVLNAGISGNRLLSDGYGPSALSRFDRDVLTRPGVRTVIILIGINDLIRSHGTVRSAQLIKGYGELTHRARAAGLRVIGATLTPYGDSRGFTRAGETQRRNVNRWIRTGGAFDEVIDFDALLRDGRHPARLRADYDPGDHLHPTVAGYAAMAEAVRAATESTVVDPPPRRHPAATVLTAIRTFLREDERHD
ncbi:SGNH/GDSL hydrolase family protein [Microlunatus parietis]|uniref:Lysophospholipase L1-like esterase n=1 Tax=Microlunatus parietis TaxID=682979 RepID=A0A7Y9I8X5_9ACTN|nr:SGNH/GDSL hydrolase family protein [Microlunatus parietis]NYE72367.1 lysophospholipase L1-like esterase [Microlunatus parietis]